MVSFEKRRSVKALSVMIAVLLTLNVIMPVISPLSRSFAAEPVQQSTTYANPYIISEIPNEESARGTTAASASEPSSTISTVADILALAAYSRTDNCEGKTYSISASLALDLSSITEFKGIGSAEFPFAGTINGIFQTGVQNEIVLGEYSFFSYLSNKASLSQIMFTANSSSSGIADTLVLDSATSGTYTDITVKGSVLNHFTGENAGMVFGKVSKIAAVTSAVSLDISDITVLSDGVTAYNGNAGLIIGQIDSGVKLNLVSSSGIAPVSGSVKAYCGNAGILVGNLAENAELTLTGNLTVDGDGSTENITAIRLYNEDGAVDAGGNAGAVAGNLESGANLSITGTVAITDSEIGGGNSIGGIIGKADNAAYSATTTTLATTTVRGGVYCGGIYGYLSNPVSDITPSAADSYSATLIATDDISFGKSTAGGLIGKLDLNTENSASAASFSVYFTNGSAIAAVFKNVEGTGDDVDAEAGKNNIIFGGLIGIYGAGSIADSLQITAGSSVKSVCSTTYTDTAGVYSYGGVIGLISDSSYCKLKNISESTSSNDVYALRFGGINAVLLDGAILDADTVTVDSKFCSKYGEAYTAGLVAKTGVGAVLRLSGTTAFSNNTYGITSISDPIYAANSAQLVAYQESSLIFAEDNWSFNRCSGADNVGFVMDDIGNYGEVFRNTSGAPIVFSDSAHTVTITPVATSSVTASSASLTLNNKNEAIALAITLGSHGIFSGVTGINADNYTNLLDAEITIGSDISFAGTGIVCLTRNDTVENSTFTGVLDGGSHKITLASGETYGNGGTHGNGGIYGQQYIGLFSALGDTAEINNLTIEGDITCSQSVSSHKLSNDRKIYASGLAGYAEGGVSVSGVTTSVKIFEKNSRESSNDGNIGYYGGLIGYYSGNGLEVSNCTGDADITVNSAYSTSSYAQNNSVSGGLVGYIKFSDDGIRFNNITLTGSITASGEIETLKAGGLFAEAVSTATTPDKTIVIDQISIPQTGGQTINAPDSTVSCGSLIAHTATNLTIKLTNTSVGKNVIYGSVTSGSANLGGLFFRISGKLAVDKTEVKSTFVSGSASGNFSDGVVVCLGYELYMTVDAQSVTIAPLTFSESAGNRYDDLVGNNKKDTNGENGGIVTIETAGDGIGSTEHTWNYSSDTAKENPNTRYYYNIEGLDKDHSTDYLNNLKSSNFTCKEDLLLWHILNYSDYSFDKTIRNVKYTFNGKKCLYFFANSTSYSNAKNYTATADIDLSGGICIYPTSVSEGSYDFKGYTITFDNTSVNASLAEDAKTTDTLCQHYMMQNGLFLNVSKSITVKNLEISGNVGMSGNGSGALICGTVSGASNAVNNFTVSGLVLKDLYVNGCNINNNYAPLLINKISSYSNTQITGVTENYESRVDKAGSSLIGNVGSATATHINISFSEMVLDASSENSLFYRASFMESFRYAADGSSMGLYNFNIGEDWVSATNHPQNVTYGYELTADETKYLDNSSIYVDPTTNNHTSAPAYDFDSYLPYVYLYVNPGSNTNVNKINVNISGNLTDGCGTYEDPYIITTPQQLKLLQTCLNGSIPTSWQVNYPNDALCEGSDHTLYTYTGGSFKNGATTNSDINISWFAHAYYKLGGSIVLFASDNFYGLGGDNATCDPNNAATAFAGVFIGRNTDDTANFSITMACPEEANGTVTKFGFINYSAGCVLKDIDIIYSDAFAVSKTENSFFGGAIGTVMGGDNIIDNVCVIFEVPESVTVSSRLTYIGGYIGFVNSGGVIFRNMDNAIGASDVFVNETSVVSGDDTNWYYTNPYIGRVLDGFALYENTDRSKTINNTDKNYTIPTLSPDTSLVTVEHPGTKVDGITPVSSRQYNQVTVKNADGLYVFASALSSGVESTGLVFAYGGVSRVRNANYGYVGNYDSSNATAIADRTTAIKDNAAIPAPSDFSNTLARPYLATYYMTGDYANYVTSNSQRTLLSFAAGGNFDMTDYGNGFRGIGSIYSTTSTSESYSIWSNKTVSNRQSSMDRTIYLTEDIGNRVSFEGRNNTVILNMHIKQYTDDTYPATSIGLFNRVNNSGEQKQYTATYQNVTVSGELSLLRYNFSTGVEDTVRTGYCTGGLVGSTVTNKSNNALCNMVVQNVAQSNLDILAMGYSGGVIGQLSGRKTIALKNCSAENSRIIGRKFLSAFIGTTSAPLNAEFDASQVSAKNITLVSTDGEYLSGVGGVVGRYDGTGTGTIQGINFENIKVFGSNSFYSAFAASPDMSNSELAALLSKGTEAYCGGIIGYSRFTGSMSVTETTIKDSLFMSINGAAGLVAYSDKGDFDFDDATLTNCKFFSKVNAAGGVGYANTSVTVNCNNVTVGGADASDGCIIVSTLGGTTRSGGIVGGCSSTFSASNTTVNNNLIYSSGTAGGIIGVPNHVNAVTTINTASVINNDIIVDNGDIVGGVIGKTISDSYISNITLSDNVIATLGGKNYAGGIAQSTTGLFYGSNILWKNNTMGITATTYADICNRVTPVVATNVNCATWITIGDSKNISLMAISRQDMDAAYAECGGSDKVLIYADYNGTIGTSATDKATLGEQVPVSPQKNLTAADTLYGDGIATGIPSQIYSESSGSNFNRYGYVFNADNVDYMSSIQSYIASVSADANLPLLYVKGDANALITDYVNLLTNGGYKEAVGSTTTGISVSATAQSYSLENGAFEKRSGDHGSIEYSDKRFVAAQNYDSLIKNSDDVTGMHFTVVTVRFTNPTPTGNSSFATHDMSFVIYYPQVLTVDTNVEIVNHEEYNIQSIIATSQSDKADAAIPQKGEPAVNITSGGTFTAYFEYVYNELRTGDDWNYQKGIKINEGLPVGTKITLVDLNSAATDGTPDSTGYRAYYTITTTAKETGAEYQLIMLESFMAHDGETPAQAVALMNLPDFNAGTTISWHDYGETNTTDYGSERYLIVINLPAISGGSNQQYRYTLSAALDETEGTERNVELTPVNDHRRVVTAWPNPEITVTANNTSNTTISRNDAISTDFDYSVVFPSDYVNTFASSSPKYGVIRYTLTDGTHNITLPAGTVITINDGNTENQITLDGTSSFYQSVIKDDDNSNLNILSDLAAVLPRPTTDIFSYSEHIELDFSNVDPTVLKNTFSNSSNYQLKSTFYLTSDVLNPSVGDTASNQLNITCELNNDAFFRVSVDNDSMMHLGYNILDTGNTTNDGVINYHIILDLSECSESDVQAIKSSTIEISFKLYKKDALSGSYIEVPDTDYTVYLVDVPSLSLTSTDYDSTHLQYSKGFDIKLKTTSDFANYKFEVSAKVNGIQVSGEPLTLSDYFIYTITKIEPIYADR